MTCTQRIENGPAKQNTATTVRSRRRGRTVAQFAVATVAIMIGVGAVGNPANGSAEYPEAEPESILLDGDRFNAALDDAVVAVETMPVPEERSALLDGDRFREAVAEALAAAGIAPWSPSRR